MQSEPMVSLRTVCLYSGLVRRNVFRESSNDARLFFPEQN